MSVLEVNNLRISYGSTRPIYAIRGLSLEIETNEIVGLAGESGCGKSTLAMALLGLLPSSAHIETGTIRIGGREVTRASSEEWRRLRWTEIAIVPQSAINGLNPVLPIIKQMRDVIIDHGGPRSSKELRSKCGQLLEMVDVDIRWLDAFPHELSGGMRQRVMIAIALALDPRLLILDEPTTALDVVVQARILKRLRDLQAQKGFSVIFITHDISLLLAIASRISIMYAGKIVEEGKPRELLDCPLHPYTRGLIDSFPSVTEKKRVIGIPGAPPDLSLISGGCPFQDRCSEVLPRCSVEAPTLIPLENKRKVSCLLHDGSGNEAIYRE